MGSGIFAVYQAEGGLNFLADFIVNYHCITFTFWTRFRIAREKKCVLISSIRNWNTSVRNRAFIDLW